MNILKAAMITLPMSFFLLAGTAQAASIEDLDVTITTMDADDQAAGVANEIQLPKEMEDSKDDHGKAAAGDDDHHEQEANDDRDEHEDLDENEAEDSHDVAEDAHEDSTDELDSSSPDSSDSTDMTN